MSEGDRSNSREAGAEVERLQTDKSDDALALALYDEQLRQGVPEGVAAATAGILPAARPSAKARACLRVLERIWPRQTVEDSSMPLPRRIGRFEIVRLLGRGGFGIVYLAHDPALGRQVALKIPRPHSLDQRGVRERFLREAQATAKLQHPHIVPIYDVGADGQTCFISSMYCPGVNLAEWLKLQAGPVPCRVAATLVAMLADAIHYSHSQGVLHRDLKPANVLCKPPPAVAAHDSPANCNELPFIPQLTDFGLAKLIEDGLEETGSSVVLGTPLYMAPEQAEGLTERIGPPTDVYALGAMLYEVLTRRPPFPAASFVELLDQLREWQPISPRSLRRDVPRSLETICLKCLRKESAGRYATAQELARDLRRYLRDEPITGRAESLWSRLRRWMARPQRIPDAGTYTLALNCLIIVWMLANLVLIQTGHLPALGYTSSTMSEVYVDTTLIIFGLHVPQSWLGWRMLRRSRLALRIGLAASIVESLFFLAVLTGLVQPPFRGPYTDAYLRTNIFNLLFLSFTVQALLQYAGLAAFRARRKASPTHAG